MINMPTRLARLSPTSMAAICCAMLLIINASQMAPGVDNAYRRDYLTWSADGDKIAISTGYGILSVWDVLNLTQTHIIQAYEAVPDEQNQSYLDFAWSPNGQQLVTGGYDTSLNIWNVRDGQLVKTIFEGDRPVGSVDWGDDGRFIGASGVFEDNFPVWNAANSELVWSEIGGATSIAFSPNLKFVGVGGAGGIRIIDISKGEVLFNLPRREGFTLVEAEDWLGTVIWTPDSKKIIGLRFNNTIEVWDLETKQLRYTFENSGFPWVGPVSIDFDTVNNTFSLVGLDGVLQTRDMTTGALIAESQVIEAGQASAFSPYGGRLAVIAAQADRAANQSPLEIVVLFASIERVQGIAKRCSADAENPSADVTVVLNAIAIESLTELTLPAFVDAVNALPEGAIPAACRADLVAVAEASLPATPD